MASITQPRIVLAALRGGSGKTILTLGLLAAWRDMGYEIAPFKKGPDFIDAGWLSFAAGRACYNLDSFLMNEDQIVHSFISRSQKADISVIEGNRGLFDGLDVEGRCSTAEIAKILKAPVILIVDVSMATRTVAAIIKGCQVFDPRLYIAGVILNRAAGPRQIALITKAVEKYCSIPVVGVVPRLQGNTFPERHMGLVPYQERENSEKAIRWAKEAVRENLQLEHILRLARETAPLEMPPALPSHPDISLITNERPRIGYILDRSFWFYYPENLEQLERMGARLVQVDALSDPALPELDALYIGGGFPETQAQPLADNRTFRHSLKKAIDGGLPVYAECGGLMYLGEGLVLGGNAYPMVGALPLNIFLEKKSQGHGYTIMEVQETNPYFPIGTRIVGHEFHYSRALLTIPSDQVRFAFRVKRGHGVDGENDGLVRKNLLATYTHIHAGGNNSWGRAFFSMALKQKSGKNLEIIENNN
jgi:cobyrinic acid a,c-diamide synthase